ncbi:hypothetical protein POMI540_2135 [Schizosaccharomyces pombe]|uniref:Uncharacterized protein new4 n=1 Tax=Schizosaccharomyces pombe (strain 972 / ATCC 24843) TaxID=284812 RepID=NEW4_SCHPO|nr:protein new4 [Schizosaccharomyces pombe]G2TRM6.1 RecName: Full=Uncharacterized protein new4 [Schizosaccharomyces pombe 972h-]CCD31328.1 conserved eukaryotic protein [Schizosaccharomyces pombe]|eukprot:NP_001343118.1 protein new4 [Schizosaccharomyces pombe]
MDKQIPKFEITRSSLLDQCKSFLPELEKANQTLLEHPDSQQDVQNLSDESNYIEMDLALGVLEKQPENSISEDTESEIQANENQGTLEHLMNLYNSRDREKGNEVTLTDFLHEKLSRAAQADLEHEESASIDQDEMVAIETRKTKK